MKFLSFLLLASIAFGEAPESVDGLIYRVRSSPIVGGGSSAPFEMHEAFLLGSDGTYSRLYGIRWGLRDTPQWTYQPLTRGSYTYTKTSATTATLAMSPQDGVSAGTKILSFTSGWTGSIPGGQGFQFSDPKVANPLLNLSTRLFVPPGKSAIVGFVAGEPMRAVLIRAVGPGLASFGVTGFLKNPRITVFRSTSLPPPQTNDDWEEGGLATSIQRIQSIVGAFPFAPGSKDASLVVPIKGGVGFDGTRSVVVDSSDASDSGEVLLEVYLIP